MGPVVKVVKVVGISCVGVLTKSLQCGVFGSVGTIEISSPFSSGLVYSTDSGVHQKWGAILVPVYVHA